MRTWRVVMWISAAPFVLSVAFYFVARRITATEWAKLRTSVFFGSDLDIYPGYNWAHYSAAALFCVGVAVIIAALLLRRSENG